jgi:hypothetical protein
LWVARKRFQNGEVKTQALAARRRRRYDEVASAHGELESVGLMAVELGNALMAERAPKAFSE